MLTNPFWGKVMAKYGITNWNDMKDQEKNVMMARLILTRNNWDNTAEVAIKAIKNLK